MSKKIYIKIDKPIEVGERIIKKVKEKRDE